MRDVTARPRLVLLLLFGAVPLMLVHSWWSGLAVLLAWNLGVGVLVFMELQLTPQPDKISVRRIVSRKLSISEENEVELEVINRSPRPLQVEVIDEYPDDFESSVTEHPLELPPRSRLTLAYTVRPHRRGDFRFGRVIVRYVGVLELITRRHQSAISEVVHVYPNIRAIGRMDLRHLRQRLAEVGARTERRRGTGTEFESLKDYSADDEFRHMDWKATARRHQPTVRQYQLETSQSVVVAIDFSRPMGADAGRYSMLDGAVNAALLLGHLVVRKEDRLGMALFSDHVRAWLPPRRGRGQFGHLLDTIYNIQPDTVEPDYAVFFRTILARRLRRSLIVLFTDITSGGAAERLQQAAPLIAGRHRIFLVSLQNPHESQRQQIPIKDDAAVYREVVRREKEERVEEITRSLERLGVFTLRLTPEEAASSLLAAYLNQKLRAAI